jgi:5-methylcytosine-specific restriction protein A
MPTAALRPCRICHEVGCNHAQSPTRTHLYHQRVRGRKLQRLRARLFDQQPLCVHCQAQGRVTRAVIRDHIVPLFEHGPDRESNVQPLCQTCSDIKTAEEAKRRGRDRAIFDR